MGSTPSAPKPPAPKAIVSGIDDSAKNRTLIEQRKRNFNARKTQAGTFRGVLAAQPNPFGYTQRLGG